MPKKSGYTVGSKPDTPFNAQHAEDEEYCGVCNLWNLMDEDYEWWEEHEGEESEEPNDTF